MKKYLWIIVVVVIVAIGIVAFRKDQPQVAGEAIKIGLAVGQTGYADEWGQGELRAVTLAVEEFNKENTQQVQIITEDTKSDGVGTVNAMTKLIVMDKVPVIIGPTWGDSYQGGYPIAEKNKVVVVSPSAAFEALENKKELTYSFSTWWPQNPEIKRLQKHMTDNNLLKVVIVHDQDAFNTKMSDLFVSLLDKRLSVVEQVTIPIGTSDFRTTISKIKVKQPQAVFIMMQDTSQVGPFMKQAKELGLNVKTFSTASTEDQGNLDKFPGLFEGVLYTSPKVVEDQNYTTLAKAYEAKYGTAPTGPSFINTYNAARLILEAIANGARSGEEIRNELEKIKVAGVGMGQLYFNDNGQIAAAEFDIKTVKNGKFVKLEE